MTSKRPSGRIAVVVSLSLSLIVVLAGCRSAKSYVEKGNALFNQGKYVEANLNYRKAVQKDPTFGEGYYRAGLAELKENKVAQALQDLEQAVRLMPDNQAVKTELTNLLLGAYIGDARHPKFVYDLLVQYSDEWLKRDPNSMHGLRIKGYLAMLERRPEEAVGLFRRAVQMNPQDEKMLLSLMDALFRDNQPAEAEKAGLAFIASHPTAANVYDALFRLYSSSHRMADAGNILVRKVGGNPGQGDYVLELARYYAVVQNKPEMDKAMQMFLANPGHDPQVHLKAGDFYSGIRDWSSALDQYNAGLGAQQNDKLTYQKRIARTLVSEDKKPDALRAMNEILAKNPGDKDTVALRAGLLLRTGNPDQSREGIQQLRDLVEKNPENVPYRYALATALLQYGDLAGARTHLQEVLRRSPGSLDPRLSMADVSFRLGNFAEATQYAQSALEIDPRNIRAQVLEGRSLVRQGSVEQAATVLGNLVRQDPKSVEARIELARADMAGKRFGEAQAAFNKILASNPGDLRAIEGLVDIDVAERHPEQALARLKEELARSKDAPQVLYLTAITALRLGKFDECVDDLKRLAEKTPDSIDPQLELAGVFRLRGDYVHAIETLRKAAAMHPQDARANSMLSTLLEMDNQQQEAKALAKKALDQQPTNRAAMNNLAYLLADTGDNLDQALKLAQQAVNGVAQPYFEDTLGYVYLKKGKNDEAVQIFDKLVRKFPAEPMFAYHLGMTYFQMGDRTRAKAILTKTLQLRPSKDVETGATNLISKLN